MNILTESMQNNIYLAWDDNNNNNKSSRGKRNTLYA